MSENTIIRPSESEIILKIDEIISANHPTSSATNEKLFQELNSYQNQLGFQKDRQFLLSSLRTRLNVQLYCLYLPNYFHQEDLRLSRSAFDY